MMRFLLLILGYVAYCWAERFNFCIDNQSSDAWTVSDIWSVDNFDWQGGRRPDHKLPNQKIPAESERCYEFETNPNANGSPFNIEMTRDKFGEWVRFRVTTYTSESECTTPVDLIYKWEKPSIKARYCGKKILLEKQHHACTHKKETCRQEWHTVGIHNNLAIDDKGKYTFEISVGLTEGRTSSDTVEHWKRFKEANGFKAGIEGSYKAFKAGFEYSRTQERGEDFASSHTDTRSWHESRSQVQKFEYSVGAHRILRVERLVMLCDCFGYETAHVRGIDITGKKINIENPASSLPPPSSVISNPNRANPPSGGGSCTSGHRSIPGNCRYHEECVHGSYQRRPNPPGTTYIPNLGVFFHSSSVAGC